MDLLAFKKDILAESIALLSSRAEMLRTEISAIQEAANDETKSSAGDKYETGRERMMQEKEKLMDQLNQTAKQLVVLNGIDASEETKKVMLGSLVKTKEAYYFIGASVGQMKNWQDVFTISIAAPIAQAMLERKKGDAFTFNKKELVIQDLA